MSPKSIFPDELNKIKRQRKESKLQASRMHDHLNAPLTIRQAGSAAPKALLDPLAKANKSREYSTILGQHDRSAINRRLAIASSKTPSMSYSQRAATLESTLFRRANQKEKVKLPSIAARADQKLILNSEDDHFDNSKQTEAVSLAEDSRDDSAGHQMQEWDASVRLSMPATTGMSKMAEFHSPKTSCAEPAREAGLPSSVVLVVEEEPEPSRVQVVRIGSVGVSKGPFGQSFAADGKDPRPAQLDVAPSRPN